MEKNKGNNSFSIDYSLEEMNEPSRFGEKDLDINKSESKRVSLTFENKES